MFGQGRWITGDDLFELKKSRLDIVKKNISFEVIGKTSVVFTAVESWIATQKYFTFHEFKPKKNGAKISLFSTATILVDTLNGSILSTYDEIRERYYFNPDTTVFNAREDFKYKNISTNIFIETLDSKKKVCKVQPAFNVHLDNGENIKMFFIRDAIADCKKYVHDYLKKNK